ncbi:MAG: hypothetical protein V2I76_15220 [Roseobacter sp.]|jgi:hypothetical protein|nr:hypothetical protein [Roseobacter sp.]
MHYECSDEKVRHNRLFELLRQNNQAETTVAKVKGFAIRKISEDEMRMLQAAAVRSLQASH